MSINTRFDNRYEIQIYKLNPRAKKEYSLPRVILSEIDNQFNYRGKKSIYPSYLTRCYYKKLLFQYYSQDLNQIKKFIEMHAQNNGSKSRYGDPKFIEAMESEIKKIYSETQPDGTVIKKPAPLILRNHVITMSPLCMRVTNLMDTKTSIPVFDLLHNIVSQLDARERKELTKYYHPYNPYTWYQQFYDATDPEKKMMIQNQNVGDLDRPPFVGSNSQSYYMMKSSDLVSELISMNKNLCGSIKVLAEQSKKRDTRTVITPTELMTFIDQLNDNTCLDEFGFPIEMQPPTMDSTTLVAHGPRSTAGGVDLTGSRQTKTTFYHASVNNALDLIQAMRNRSKAIDSQQTAMKSHEEIYLMPLMTSIKNEITKKDKKIRFFTLVPAQFEILETVVYSQVLDNNNSVTYCLNGGNRLMIGNSLDRGYGTFILNTMLMRNREDVEDFNRCVKNYKGEKMKNYDEQGANTMEKAKSYITDYTSQEFQHNSIHRLLSQLSLYCFYTSHTDKTTFQMATATIGELTLQVDADMGGGKILILPPGHVGSGCKMTLTGNGQSNKYELTHAADEALISIKRGYYYVKDVTKPKNQCYIKKEINKNYCTKTILKIRNNTVFQGDDGYLATIDGDPETFEFVVLLMRELYGNQIKAEVQNLVAVQDEKGYDIRNAGDFLKIKPTITKKGIFYIRDTAAALQKMFFPNSVPYNAVTQLFAAISQSYTSNGNYYSYKLAMIKVKMLATYIMQNKISVTEDEKNEFIAILQNKAEIKGNAIIETLILNGFMELDFNTINQKFLQNNTSLIINTIEEAKHYHTYGIRRSMLTKMGVSTQY